MILIRHYSAENNRSSARSAIWFASGDCGGKKSRRFILARNAPILFRSPALVKPHHAREAYIREETVVIFATSWSDCCGRPWERRTLSAYIEEAHVARAVSTCMSISRFELSVTPKTRMVSTRVAPGIICERG